MSKEKIKNFMIIRMLNTLNAYSEKRLPPKISYGIIKNVRILQGEYVVYESQLKKLFSDYEGKYVTDESGNVTMRKDGIPVIKDEYARDFYADLDSLLNFEAEVALFKQDFDIFDYRDNERYDVLTPRETSDLAEIICL